MDDDDFDTEAEITTVVLPPRPVSRLDLLAFGFWALARAAEAAENIADEFSDLLAMHIGFTERQRQMAESAALEIETMTGGDQDG